MLNRKTPRTEASTDRVIALARKINAAGDAGDAKAMRRGIVRLGYLLARTYEGWEPGKRLASIRKSKRSVRHYRNMLVRLGRIAA